MMKAIIVCDDSFNDYDTIEEWINWQKNTRGFDITELYINSRFDKTKDYALFNCIRTTIYNDFNTALKECDITFVFWDEHNQDTGKKVYKIYTEKKPCYVCLYKRPNYIENCFKTNKG